MPDIRRSTLRVWELRDKLAEMPDDAIVVAYDDANVIDYDIDDVRYSAEDSSVGIMFSSE